jgi:hypothetical protein
MRASRTTNLRSLPSSPALRLTMQRFRDGVSMLACYQTLVFIRYSVAIHIPAVHGDGRFDLAVWFTIRRSARLIVRLIRRSSNFDQYNYWFIICRLV